MQAVGRLAALAGAAFAYPGVRRRARAVVGGDGKGGGGQQVEGGGQQVEGGGQQVEGGGKPAGRVRFIGGVMWRARRKRA